MISIVTVSYRDLDGLRRTANSLMSQTSRAFEWIVVDGGSGCEVVKFLEDSALAPKFVSERDSGIYDAMGKGVGMCTGDWIWFLNSGDIAASGDVVRLIGSHLDSADVLFFDCDLLLPSGKLLARRARPLYPFVYYGVPANQQATVYRRSLLVPELFFHSFKICGDFYLIARLAAGGASAKVVNERVAVFELGGVSTMNVTRLACEALRIQRDVWRVPMLRRYYDFIVRATKGCAVKLIYVASSVLLVTK